MATARLIRVFNSPTNDGHLITHVLRASFSEPDISSERPIDAVLHNMEQFVTHYFSLQVTGRGRPHFAASVNGDFISSRCCSAASASAGRNDYGHCIRRHPI